MIDLHLHLDGSLNPKNIPTMAKMSKVTLPFTDTREISREMTVSHDCKNLGEYLEKFDLPLLLLQTSECIEYAVYELIRDVSAQGLCYAEIRFAPQLHLQNGLTQAEAVSAAIRGRNRGADDFGIDVNLILCCMRGSDNADKNVQTVTVAKQFLGAGVCAADLAGNEAAYPTESFGDVFALARRMGVPIVIHAGEAAGAESIWHALELGAVRIGHGIHALEDERLMCELKQKKIYLEMCYSSNLQIKTVGCAADYPLLRFMSAGIGVTLNTDNLTVSGTDLKREYAAVQKQFGLSDDTLRDIALNSVDAAFITNAQKDALRKRIIIGFSDWLHR